MRMPPRAWAVSLYVILLVVVVDLLFTGCASRHNVSDQRRFPDRARHAPLFLHLLSPRYYTDPPTPPKCIVSTRIFLGEDFAVSVVSPSGEPHEVLAGRLEQHGTDYFGRLTGRSHTTVNRFEGAMELDKPIESQGGFFSGGGIWRGRFVLSTNSDCSVFF